MVDVGKNTDLKKSGLVARGEGGNGVRTHVANIVSMLLELRQLFRTDDRHCESVQKWKVRSWKCQKLESEV